MKIATWNINSIRSRLDCCSRFIKEQDPDILMLQETKCQDHQFPIDFFNDMGYFCSIKGQKSYNGVAILSKVQGDIELTSLPLEGHSEDEARYIECLFEIKNKVVRCASIYVPNGSPTVRDTGPLEETNRFCFKLAFLKSLRKRMDEVQKYNEIAVFGGDYNVAHKEIDLYNPESAFNDVGFHPMEIEQMDSLFDLGYVDLYRHFEPNTKSFSWWDYRRSGWEMNKGWRIDYMLVHKSNLEIIDSCQIISDTRGWNKPSDHCPVLITIKE